MQEYRSRGQEKEPSINKNLPMQTAFAKLYASFQPEFYWWILIVLLRKFCLVVCGVWLRSDPGFQLAAVLFVVFVIFCLHFVLFFQKSHYFHTIF